MRTGVISGHSTRLLIMIPPGTFIGVRFPKLSLERVLILIKYLVTGILHFGLISKRFAVSWGSSTPAILARVDRFTGVRVTSLLKIIEGFRNVAIRGWTSLKIYPIWILCSDYRCHTTYLTSRKFKIPILNFLEVI